MPPEPLPSRRLPDASTGSPSGSEPPNPSTSRTSRLDAYQREHTWLGFPIGVFYKFFDDRGPHLAATITYYGFVSLFPLLLLLVSILDLLAAGSPQFQKTLLHSALRDFPIVGGQLRANVKGFSGSGQALVVGVVGLLYGGMGVTQAAQAAFNRIYAVPRNEQPNPLTSRVRSLLLLLVLGTAVLLTTGISVLVNTAKGISGELAPWVTVGGRIFTAILDIVIFTASLRLLVARQLKVRKVLIGGALAGVGWYLLQTVGTVYLSGRLEHSRELYGTFGLVLATLAWIYIEAIILIFCAEINVTLHDRLWPRSLLTPFTDDVMLTPADERAYAGYARSERYKGIQTVESRFDQAHETPPARRFDPESRPSDDTDGRASSE